jgi:hypothetical protein
MLYSQLGYFLTSRIKQYYLKEAVMESLLGNLPDSELVSISLNANQKNISWEEEGREFTLNGKLYDVVRTLHQNDQTFLLCSSDEKEDAVLENMNKITQSNQQKSGKQQPPIVNLVYDCVLVHHEIDLSLYISSELPGSQHTCFIPSTISNIVLPPPKA